MAPDKIISAAAGVAIALLAWNLNTTQALAVQVSAYAENSNIRLKRLEEWTARLADRIGNIERKSAHD
jgi:hypothetical protein